MGWEISGDESLCYHLRPFLFCWLDWKLRGFGYDGLEVEEPPGGGKLWGLGRPCD